jgi:hypothetical protein
MPVDASRPAIDLMVASIGPAFTFHAVKDAESPLVRCAESVRQDDLVGAETLAYLLQKTKIPPAIGIYTLYETFIRFSIGIYVRNPVIIRMILRPLHA